MDAFVATHSSARYEGPDYGPLTVGYHTRADLPTTMRWPTPHDLRQLPLLGPGPTHPNRLMSVSGTIDPAGSTAVRW